ncbi:hypothetical protein VE25_16380 [Devosia geojensis]|uniref:Uncharacterized protein n=1 Tax=Devosia geojensis TaxID=443610 RepID=A0A0F5FRE3_9HYPH|nr:hypothetical protein [Devosia geojensis]KKB10737.1 hypothetical protein VE25_16380 [Devosia geojensis]
MRWTTARFNFRSATRRVRLAGLGAICLLFGLAGTPYAQDQVSEFRAACTRSATLMGMTQTHPDGLERLCDCLAADFEANLSPADIETLSRDLLGELTPAERASNPEYRRLSAYGGQAVGACLLIEGFEDGARAPADPE